LRRPDGASTPRPPDRTPRVSWNAVEPGYFATMKIPLLDGRDFAMSDRADSQPVAVVSEQAGRRLWPGENAIGKFLPASLGDLGKNALVIGVVRDVAVITGPQTSPGIVYRPLMQRFFPHVTIAVRSANERRMGGEIRAVLAVMDPNISILTYQTLESAVSAALAPQRNAAAV